MSDLSNAQLETRLKHIRNFSIIAHIDHGKSTIADRILELTNTVSKREMQNQILDDMDIERERGITIKLNAIELEYKAKDGETYVFHLIDTPGHVDFSYEVSRSLAACEGALLIVDASQGVQAQTVSNVYLALENDLDILPVINKIDLPSADVEATKQEIEDIVGIPADDSVLVSAKTAVGIPDLLERIVTDIKPPENLIDQPVQALIFDSYYDSYKGVVLLVRVKSGILKVGDQITLMNSKKQYEILELGVHRPAEVKRSELMTGDVGFIVAGIRDISEIRVGDTITLTDNPAKSSLEGYRESNPMVYAGIYPIDNAKFPNLRESLEKLKLNDAALTFEPETSQALGFGFRCGFLGLLHMNVVQERLEREFDLDIIMTAPSVHYQVFLADGEELQVDNPSQIEDLSKVKTFKEPFVDATIMVPSEFIGSVMEITQNKRGEYQTMEYLDNNRVELKYQMPLSEIIYNYFDELKSRTKGYASLDYEISGYRESDLVKMDVLLNGEPVDALSSIVHRDVVSVRGKEIVEKLKTVIPRQQFEIPIQAAIGSKIVARSTVKSYRKNVLAKCYGGDITRKRKLLEKQKAGKKRMKAIGSVEVPQEAFMTIFGMNQEDNSK
ncbi:translation elongation factor 4 [Xylocopilactobacillus apicola]|uniref:Elongation factor 4 n=1 Tax=Xylocopilactobacillus apicola TaxID=2932184 RepID=A0AAU9DR10_9LACO|nr:translation elongation factor 4 [Xylocopilactobacillus apicola]BDR58354.1 elongation factor 4 [Xylocopilactobacillus apicola]